MPFDGIVAKSIVDELTKKLISGRIEKVLQPETDEIVLLIRAGNTNHKLVLSASPSYPRIHITNAVKENPAVPPVFCMLLRKHLTGGRILSFEFNDYERIIGIVIEASNELGDISVKKLLIEIMGRYSNIILINSENKIIDSIKHVDSDISSVREVMPARPYILPPAQDKISPESLKTDVFFEKLSLSNKAVDKFLLETIKGFSPLLCREVCTMAEISARTSTALLDDNSKMRLCSSLNKVLDEIMQGAYSPCVIFEDAEMLKPIDFHCLGIKQYANILQLSSVSEALDTFYVSRDNAERLKQKKADLYKVLHTSIERCSKKLAIQHDTLRDVADREKLKLYGELITANIYAIPRNTDSVKLLNYYSEDGETINVPLDPDMSPSENAQRYFKKYSKAKNTYAYTTRQLKDSQKEMEYLESVLQLLDNCTELKEIDEVRQELSEQGYMILKRKNRKSSKHTGLKKKDTVSPPLHFSSSDGFDIYVGKNNKQNDYLTLKLAQSNDLWLHTKNIPGSHVIIKRNGRSIPDSTVEEAACLAAWHSKASMSSNVAVDYTAVKNVSKPSGAKPGMVIYVNYKTAIVTPDRALAERLIIK